jgi:hypothetical protein
MSDEVTIRKQLADAPVWSERARELEDALIQSVNERLRTEAAAEAARLKPAGSWAVEQPEPPPAAVEEPPEPLRLSSKFAGHEATLARVEQAAKAAGFSDRLPGIFALLDSVQGHEVVTGDPEARLAAADRLHDQLVLNHGEEGAEEIVTAWQDALRTLGVTELIRVNGLDTHYDTVEFIGQSWLRRSRTGGA